MTSFKRKSNDWLNVKQGNVVNSLSNTIDIKNIIKACHKITQQLLQLTTCASSTCIFQKNVCDKQGSGISFCTTLFALLTWKAIIKRPEKWTLRQ